MKRALLAGALAVATALSGVSAQADEGEQRLPINDPGVAGRVAAMEPCGPENKYDQPDYYGDDCRRLKIVFGPIVVQPGKNDVLIQPVTLEKPMWDGYMVRFRPGLIDYTGYAPAVEDLHLHHGTWLNPGYFGGGDELDYGVPNPARTYGWGPWLATGEEKTIVANPYRYGLKILATDSWLFLHMVHSALATPTVVWVHYDVDMIEASTAEAIQEDGRPLVTNTKGIWLDVGGGHAFNEAGLKNDDAFPNNPVYNVQGGFGRTSAGTIDEYVIPGEEAEVYGLGDQDKALDVCAWPAENCARENSSGNVSYQQGNDISDQVDGSHVRVTSDMAGTIVVLGGHLHMGGLNDIVSLKRKIIGTNGEEKWFTKVVHISDAYYWNWSDPSKVGALPTSWDVSMSGTSADLGWKLNIKENDFILLNATYDTDIGSWYENMGIVMAWVAPGEESGIDPFADCTWDGVSEDLDNCSVSIGNGLLPDRGTGDALPKLQDGYDTNGNSYGRVLRVPAAPGWVSPGENLPTCVPSATQLCTRGQITHGHIPSSGNHEGCYGNQCTDEFLQGAIAAGPGPVIDEVNIAGFVFGESDFGIVGATGIPRVPLGGSLRFVNEDAAWTVPHTATTCRYPCTGDVSTHYPISDSAERVTFTPDPSDDPDFTVLDAAGSKKDDLMSFDTTQLGYTIGAAQRLDYTVKATRLGRYTYFCRIHPFMRGIFDVVDPSTV